VPLVGCRRDRQTDGRTDSIPYRLHRRSPLEAGSVGESNDYDDDDGGAYRIHEFSADSLSSLFTTARRYASAVYVVVCPPVRPSVPSRYCIETTGRIELVFGTEASFHLSHTVL